MKHINFRLVEVDDADFILKLRINTNKNKFLSKVKNDLNAQKKWLEEYKEREKVGAEYYYLIMERDERLGVVRLYDFQGNSFCWGSWLLQERAPSYAAIESALLVYEIGFFLLNFKFSHFEVRNDNKKVISFHKRFGAKVISKDEHYSYFNFDIKIYKNTKTRYRKFFK